MEGYVAEVHKLKALCVNCIIKNFDRLMLQYDSGEVPKAPFKHLQITQSPTLLKKFSREMRYEKYMKFILNSSAKNIDLRSCDWNIKTVMIQLQTIAKTIINLSISGPVHKHHLLVLCRQMKKLESLMLHGTSLTCMIFRTIGRCCSALQTLSVCSCDGVTDKNISALCPVDKSAGNSLKTRCKNTTLKSIDLRETSVTCVGIAFILEHFLNIEFIRHLDVFVTLCNIHSKSFGGCDVDTLRPYNLKKLIISVKSLSFQEDALKMCCTLCPHLRELSLGKLSSQSQLDAISGFTGLTKISITSQQHLYLDLTSFIKAKGKNLRVLILKGCSLSTPVLLNCCPKLITLKLEDMTFKSMEELGSMPPKHYFQDVEALHIEYMDFSVNDVSKSVSAILSSAPNLEKLTFLSSDGITHDFVDSLAGCVGMEKLQDLNVINTEIESLAVINLLLICPNAKKYNLKDTPIRFQDYNAMHISRPFVKITTDYSAFVRDEIVESSDDEDSWMDDHVKDLSDDNDSWSGDSEFELDDSDASDELNFWIREEEDYMFDDDIWEFESDYIGSSDVSGQESSDTSDDDDDGNSDTDQESVDDEDDSSWADEVHENSGIRESQAVLSRKRRRSSTDDEAQN